MRVGIGFDVHRLVPDRPLILGGVSVPYQYGLLGHSDADVLTHAIMDALLGAAGLGDIGRHFPDTDDQYKNADSLQLLQQVHQLIQKHNWSIGNIDAVIMAQAPKLAPYIKQMQQKIAAALDIDTGAINIKATTTEKLGLVGRKEGIAAQAVVLLVVGRL